MKYLSEFRDPVLAKKILERIHETAVEPCVIMEICGGQTHSIVKHGINQLLPRTVELVHGPGCPVCVTPLEKIDRALAIASRKGVIFASFGDMLRVPGSHQDLLTVKSEGGDVRMVYSPLEALKIAEQNRDKKVVFFAIGFETTAPLTAMTVLQAERIGLDNFSMLVSHVLVPPAIAALQRSPNNRVNGYLAAGHVCAVMGTKQYDQLSDEFKLPIVVTGFEPVDILEGIYLVVKQLHENRHEVENQYSRVVVAEGNLVAQQAIDQVFEVTTQRWRGIGPIADSGLKLRERYRKYDAEVRFSVDEIMVEEPRECFAGEILQGLKRPDQCPSFGNSCTPTTPLGATMVSSEGACAAYYRYNRKVRVV